MAKERKISVNEYDAAVESIAATNLIEWNDLEITVRRRIPYEDFVTGGIVISNACFGEDGAYVPEAKDVSFRLFVLSQYTNLSIPQNLEKRYEMACFSGIFDAVLTAIDRYQLEQLKESVNERIRVRTEAAVDAVVRQANSVAEAVQNLSEKFEAQFSDLLGDVTPEELNRVIHGIAEGQVDEEKVVDAYKKTRRVSVSTLPAGVLEDN